jgi:hypothetical protein
MVHSADHQLTYLRTLYEVTKQNVKDTAYLARTLRDSIRNFSLQLHRVEADSLGTKAGIEKYAIVRQFKSYKWPYWS